MGERAWLETVVQIYQKTAGRCNVKSVTNIYMLGIFWGLCSWMHKVYFPSKRQWAQSTNWQQGGEGGDWSSWLTEVQSHSCFIFCCHWILKNMNISNEIFMVLFFYLVVLSRFKHMNLYSCTWTLLESLQIERLILLCITHQHILIIYFTVKLVII